MDRRRGERRSGGAQAGGGHEAAPLAAAPGPLALAEPGRRASRAGAAGWQHRYAGSLVAVDAGMVALAALAAYAVRFLSVGPPQLRYLLGVPTLPLVWCAAMAAVGGYQTHLVGRAAEETKRALQATGLVTVLVSTFSYAAKQDLARGYLLAALPFAALFVLGGRQAARAVVARLRRRGLCLRRVLVVGHERSSHYLIAQLALQPRSELRVVGACVPGGASPLLGRVVPVLGDIADIAAVAAREAVDVIAVTACVEVSEGALRRLAWQLEGSGIQLMVVPGIVDVDSPRLYLASLGGVAMLQVVEPALGGLRAVLKEVFDRTVASLLLVTLTPVLAALWLAVRFTSRGPAIFRQIRIGRDGRPFTVYKFRSMCVDAEARLGEILAQNVCADGLLFKVRDDPRVTPMGAWLRRTSLDELPQLLNVVRGQMSLVGPRPPLPGEVERYGHDLRRRLLVKPGMTGLWQVSGRSNLSWDESMRLDLRYVENWSLTLDAAILWRTVRTVLRGSGAY